MSMQALVEKYIQLRDVKAKIAAKAKEQTAVVTGVMDRIEAQLLADFTAQGIDNVKTPDGTAYKTSRTSATVADWDAVLDFVQNNDRFDMIDKKVNKTAVAEYIELNQTVPPGVNWREEFVINVRRA